MTALVEQLNNHHTTQQFLNDMTAKLYHAKLMEIVAHTKVESIGITLATINGEHRVLYSLTPHKFAPGEAMTAENMRSFHQREDGTFDLAEHGNEGMLTFLENEIEWELWNDIMADLGGQLYYVTSIYEFYHDDPSNHLVFTRDAFWVTNNPSDFT
jgi:hypothetical protein